MKKKLFITTLILIGACSGLYPTDESPNQLVEWKHINKDDYQLDRTFQPVKVGIYAGLAGGITTWGVNRLLDSSTAKTIGFTSAAALMAGYGVYKMSLNHIDTTSSNTHEQIAIHNPFADKIQLIQNDENIGSPKKATSNTLSHNDPTFIGAYNSSNKKLYLDENAQDIVYPNSRRLIYPHTQIRNKKTNGKWSQWLLGSANIKKLKDMEKKLDVVTQATKDLPAEKNRIHAKTLDREFGEDKWNYHIYWNKDTRKFVTKHTEMCNESAQFYKNRPNDPYWNG